MVRVITSRPSLSVDVKESSEAGHLAISARLRRVAPAELHSKPHAIRSKETNHLFFLDFASCSPVTLSTALLRIFAENRINTPA